MTSRVTWPGGTFSHARPIAARSQIAQPNTSSLRYRSKERVCTNSAASSWSSTVVALNTLLSVV